MVIRFVCLCCFWVSAAFAQAADFRVTFINPGGKAGFWGEVSETMSAAARDLDIDLEILHADRKPYGMEELLQERLRAGDLPDYFVFVNEHQAGARLMQLLAGHPSKVLFLLNKLSPKQKLILEKRHIDLRNIVASIVPDNETAGYETAEFLFEETRKMHPSGKDIRLLALTGDTVTPAGIDIELGLMRAVADNRDVRLLHAIPVQWNEEVAYARAERMLAKGPIDAIWGASDEIALGAIRAVEEAGLQPGKDVLFTGINWSSRAMKAVSERKMLMSHGGHIFAGAWSMVMLHDYHHKTVDGAMFVDVYFKMSPITLENVDLFLTRLGDRDWEKIDFRQFSKTATARSRYDFSTQSILDAAGS